MRQLARWIEDVAHARVVPATPFGLLVRDALAQERPHLLPLPEHPSPVTLVRAVVSGKTPYIRFDGNDYSIPHTLVRRPLTLVATDTVVPLVDGATEVAHHVRSYDQGQRLEDPPTWPPSSRETPRARSARPRPPAPELSAGRRVPPGARPARGAARPADAGASSACSIRYGAAALEAALADALTRGAIMPPPSPISWTSGARARRTPPPLAVVSPDDPRVRDLRVTPHRLSTYDALLRPPPARRGPMAPLNDTLNALGLHHTATHLDDLVALATKRRWSPFSCSSTSSRPSSRNAPGASLERRLARAQIGRFTIDRLVHRAEIISIEGTSYRRRAAEISARAARPLRGELGTAGARPTAYRLRAVSRQVKFPRIHKAANSC